MSLPCGYRFLRKFNFSAEVSFFPEHSPFTCTIGRRRIRYALNQPSARACEWCRSHIDDIVHTTHNSVSLRESPPTRSTSYTFSDRLHLELLTNVQLTVSGCKRTRMRGGGSPKVRAGQNRALDYVMNGGTVLRARTNALIVLHFHFRVTPVQLTI